MLSERVPVLSSSIQDRCWKFYKTLEVWKMMGCGPSLLSSTAAEAARLPEGVFCDQEPGVDGKIEEQRPPAVRKNSGYRHAAFSSS